MVSTYASAVIGPTPGLSLSRWSLKIPCRRGYRNGCELRLSGLCGNPQTQTPPTKVSDDLCAACQFCQLDSVATGCIFSERDLALRSRDIVILKLSSILLFCLCSIPRAQGTATLFLQQPYSYDAALAGTGHAAVYLSNVCSSSPVVLRPCAPGESGVVISRYQAIAGYDWIAIPLIPYLYAVEQPEDVHLYADAKLVAFLRDRYRRAHLLSLAPDLPDGGTPGGEWYQLVGASYLRTIYAFEIETSPEQDAQLIARLNTRPNRKRWALVTSNCADFAREIINFYYPHALHRSIIFDLGVTTPKQLAKLLSRYGRRHSHLETSNFVIGQVPGTMQRSKPNHGVLECVLTAKKYMLPLFAIHPYIMGSLIAGYFVHGRFDPAQNALIMDSSRRLDAPVTRAERRAFLERLEELSHNAASPLPVSEEKNWDSLQAGAEPKLDSSGMPVVQVKVGAETIPVGIARPNILNLPESSELGSGLMQARLRQELRPATSRWASRADVESDLVLLQKLLAQPPTTGSVSTSVVDNRVYQ